MTDKEIAICKEIICDLNTYCALTPATYKPMGFEFQENDFICLNNLIDLINRQKEEIERLQSRETRWLVIAGHLGRMEELRMKLFKFSNMNLEEIIEYFAKGYTLVPPEPPNFNEFAKLAEEMTEGGNGNNI